MNDPKPLNGSVQFYILRLLELFADLVMIYMSFLYLRFVLLVWLPDCNIMAGPPLTLINVKKLFPHAKDCGSFLKGSRTQGLYNGS